MTSKEKIEDILDFVQINLHADHGFMVRLKQELEHLSSVAQIDLLNRAEQRLRAQSTRH